MSLSYWLIGVQFIFLCVVAGFFFATGQRWSVRVWNKWDDWYAEYTEERTFQRIQRKYEDIECLNDQETSQIEVTLEPANYEDSSLGRGTGSPVPQPEHE